MMGRRWAWLAACAVLAAACDPRLYGRAAPAEDSKAKPQPQAPDDEPAPPAPPVSPFGALAALSGAREPGPFDEPLKSKGYTSGKPYAAVLPLSGRIVELDRAFSWSFMLGGGESIALRSVTDRLRGLAGDDKVSGVVLRLGAVGLSMAGAEELRAAIAGLGKPVYCHADAYDNLAFLVASACASVAVAPGGEVMFNGPSVVPLYLKGLLDLIGVQADFLHVGAYKGAAEPLTRTEPSPEMRQTYEDLVGGAYARLQELVAAGRKRDAKEVAAWIDEGLFTAERARAAGLVDEIAPFEAFRDAHAPDGAWKKLRWREGDGGMQDLMGMLGLTPKKRVRGPHIALLYAIGEVNDGTGGAGSAFEEIASGKLVPALAAAAANDDVKAVVLRVDSPGGSALASELIYRAMRALAARKPVIVSMGELAASGGYYISAGATRIFAQPDTLTGSIGVVGGKLVIGGGLAKLGVHATEIGRGKRALLSSTLRAWNDDERQAVRGLMEAVYGDFKARVAEGRKLDVAVVEKHAQGRVFTGAEALTRGLVDELGSLEDALASARSAAGLPADAVIAVYPGEPTLLDFLAGLGGVRVHSGLEAALAGPLAAAAPVLGPRAIAALTGALRLAASFEGHPVRVVAFAPVLR